MQIFNLTLLLVVAAFAAVEVANGQSFNATLIKAEQGDAEAQNKVGEMYDNGEGVPQDFAGAVKWYRKAANQGHADAQYNLAMVCQGGRRIYDAQHNDISVMHYKGKGVPEHDMEEAVKWLRKAAEQGHAWAQCELGEIYCTGSGGVRRDYVEGEKWLRQAAEKGHAEAQNRLSWFFISNDKSVQGYIKAEKWVRKAADQGHKAAEGTLGYILDSLGDMYLDGKDLRGKRVPQDYVEAAKWYRKATERGYKRDRAQLQLDYIQDKVGDKVVEMSTNREAAEQGDAEAQWNLGLSYYNGDGVRQDYEEAAKWYRKAAAQGYAKAKKNLGELYYELGNIGYHIADNYDTDPPGKSGIEKMNRAIKKKEAYVKASKWYLKAANEGHAGAQRKLGMMYSKGEGVPKNDIEAYAWFFLAGASEISILEKRITEWQLHNAQKRAMEL